MECKKRSERGSREKNWECLTRETEKEDNEGGKEAKIPASVLPKESFLPPRLETSLLLPVRDER